MKKKKNERQKKRERDTERKKGLSHIIIVRVCISIFFGVRCAKISMQLTFRIIYNMRERERERESLWVMVLFVFISESIGNCDAVCARIIAQ